MKLYIYPQASPHVHDGIAKYVNTVPLSQQGIQKHCQVVTNPKDADYFYMGQIREDSKVPLFKSTGAEFEFYRGNEDRHIADIEGESGWDIPEWLQKCTITTMGPLKQFKVKRLFTRPTFSTMMVDAVQDRREFAFPTKKAFGFRGCINHEWRSMLFKACESPILDEHKVSREVYVNSGWAGSAPTGHPIHQVYEELMLKHPLSLCPRGAGIDTTRTIETCFYRRAPVIVADKPFHLTGEDQFDMSFCFQVIGSSSPEDMARSFVEIYKTPLEELRERADIARVYFDTIIRGYFKDPTLFFLTWLKNKN